MAKRVILAGILGGIVLFLWGGLYHEALPFGEIGLKELPNEQAIVGAMKPNLPEPGMYLFPTTGLPPDSTHAQRAAKMDEFNKKAASGPQGVLIYHPIGTSLSGTMLITECCTNIIQALLVAFVLGQVGVKRFSSRLGLAFVIGLLASITTNISLWNWYGFPSNWVLNQIVFLIIGYFLVAIVAAAIVKGAAPKATSAAA
jgi:hypothetical protein